MLWPRARVPTVVYFFSPGAVLFIKGLPLLYCSSFFPTLFWTTPERWQSVDCCTFLVFLHLRKYDNCSKVMQIRTFYSLPVGEVGPPRDVGICQAGPASFLLAVQIQRGLWLYDPNMPSWRPPSWRWLMGRTSHLGRDQLPLEGEGVMLRRPPWPMDPLAEQSLERYELFQVDLQLCPDHLDCPKSTYEFPAAKWTYVFPDNWFVWRSKILL